MGVYKLSEAGSLVVPRVNYNSMLAGNSVFVLPAYELIESTILDTATSSVLFDSLDTYASTYKHLQIRALGRSTRSSTGDSLAMRFNGITTTSYTRHVLFNAGSATPSSTGAVSQTSLTAGRISAANTTANVFGATVLDILDYSSTTKNTTIRALSGFIANETALYFESGMLVNTSAITSIELFAGTGNLVAGSRFSLYGIKGE
jgi:hypothetical protein